MIEQRIGELREIAKYRLNVGCGGWKIPGSVNVDIQPENNPDVCADARSLPYPDSSMDWVESHHMLEHLDREEAIKVIREFRRVLKPGCLMFLTVPDLPRCFEIALANVDVPELWRGMMNSIYGCQNNEYDYHKFGYSPSYLMMMVALEGFDCEAFSYARRPSPTVGLLAKKQPKETL